MATKLPFRTAYSESDRYYSPTGDGTEDVWGYEIDKYGQKVLVKQGTTNLYEKIQESLEETKIENILKRVAMGDNTVMRPDGIYADISTAPKNLIEARQQMQKLENVWNGLSKEIKEKYDYSVEKFIGASGTESWLIDMGLIDKKPEDKKTPEATKSNESEGKTE